jgi:YD repeat-containing protein
VQQWRWNVVIGGLLRDSGGGIVLRIGQLLVVCVVAIGASAACATTDRQTAAAAPADNPVQSVAAAVVSHRPWHPLHKGSADISAGVYTREDDDLVVNTPLPIVLRRTYNSGDGHPRQFGVDTTHPGEWWLYGDGDPGIPWADLVPADGGRIHFVRISPGATQEGAVLRYEGPAGEFNGALLSWSGSRWEMRFRDGSMASFLDCQGARDICWLVERRDPDGHRIAYVRDGSGTLLRMESEGQSIAFDYDDHQRIVRAYDTTQREVSYAYDDRGRLVRATGSDGIVRTYEYDDENNLVGVREPGRILQNWFDDAGRWVRQVVKGSEQDDDPYVATVRYVVEGDTIVESDFNEGAGLTVYRYNLDHDVVSETLDADGPTPIVFTYNLDPVSSISSGVTMSCIGPSGPMTRVVQGASVADEGTKDALIRESCLPRR